MLQSKASGYINKETNQWEWEQVEWKFKNGLYHSNREIPDEFWKENKWRKKGNHRRNIAGVILLRPVKNSKEYEVLIVQCYNNKFGFPKGKCNINEPYYEAALREFKEETGTDLQSYAPQNYIKINQDRNRTVVFYIVVVPSEYDIKTKPLSDVEITAFGWVKLKDIHRIELSNLARKTIDYLSRKYGMKIHLKKNIH